MSTPFFNNDEHLRTAANEIIADRRKTGLEGLVGGLTGVILNTEPEFFRPAVEEFLRYTGFVFHDAFETPEAMVCVLTCPWSADLLITARKAGTNPFAGTMYPKSKHLPNTRVETFLFTATNLERYAAIQRKRGIHFLTPEIIDSGEYRFLQTPPSAYTGNSIGFIEWRGTRGHYRPAGSQSLPWTPVKPALPHLAKIGYLDHAATRVRAEDRDPAILEFMSLTGYNFTMAIYVESLNSITNVARLPGETFALVFTSGVSPYVNDEVSGPTEKFHPQLWAAGASPGLLHRRD